ncbi:MAG: xanthine phosphoribosyltransferase [Alphaproteobacteria bacterium]|nr:xanthine phosphoribosyltransferase [Alphaproteobacteria bacterium]
MSDKIYIEWSDFHQDVKFLCQKIKESGSYNRIIAVSRGGMIPAGIISYELSIRNTNVINMVTYVGNKHLEISEVEGVDVIGDVDEKTLIIDDLTDSGQTFRVLRKYFSKAKFVSVYAKKEGEPEVDIVARKLPNNWVVFPWDVD